MGTYNKTYIGFFLRVPITTAPVTETFRVKPNGKRANTRFNPETGEEYLEKTETKLVKNNPTPYIYDVDGMVEDTFWRPEYIDSYENETIFICNSTNFKTSDECTISLLNYPIESNKIGFVRKYQKYIDYYTEKYGHITIDFGVINYTH